MKLLISQKLSSLEAWPLNNIGEIFIRSLNMYLRTKCLEWSVLVRQFSRFFQTTHRTTVACQTSAFTPAGSRWTTPSTSSTSSGVAGTTTLSGSPSFTATHLPRKDHLRSIQFTPTGLQHLPLSDLTRVYQATGRQFRLVWMVSSIPGRIRPLWVTRVSRGGLLARRVTTTSTTTTSRGWSERCSLCKRRPRRLSRPRRPVRPRPRSGLPPWQARPSRHRSRSSWCRRRPRNTKRLFELWTLKNWKFKTLKNKQDEKV